MSQASTSATTPPGEPPADGDDLARGALESTVALSLRILRAAMVVLAAIFLGSGFFTVEQHEVALVRRFGRTLGAPDQRLLEPGAHWSWPVIDEVVRVPARRVERVETTAFALALTNDELATGKPAKREGGLDPARDGYLVTGDANLVHAGIAVRYEIVDPYAFVTRAIDAPAAVRPLLEGATTRTAATRPIDDLLTNKKEAFLEAVRQRAQDELDALGIGIRITGVELARDMAPSPQVHPAFASVSRALQDRDRLESEARAAAAESHGKTLADAQRIREQGSSEAQRLKVDLTADVAVHDALAAEWRRNRAGVADRLLGDLHARTRPEETFLLREGDPLRIRLERDTKAIQDEVLRRWREGGK